MPTLRQAKSTIRQKFIALGLVDPTLIAHDNQRFARPDPLTSWIRLTIIPGASQLQVIGGTKKWRHPGVFVAQLFGPEEVGDRSPDTMAETIFSAFSSKKIDGVTYFTVSTQPIGVSDAWWQVNVTCPWHADQTGS